MAPILDDLLNDSRLSRLFSAPNRFCALQLWVLQIRSDHPIENRIVYGRLLPYSYSNNCWSFSDNDNWTTLGHIKAKITRLNLYIDSSHCRELLTQLAAGQSLSAISKALGIEAPKRLMKQFGTTALTVKNLAYRLVACLPNRDVYDSRSISSPHSTANAFSGSITQVDKDKLFRLGEEYSPDLTAFVIKQLNLETGLDFGKADAIRFGDLELLVFPALNNDEQDLLKVKWTESPYALSVLFDPLQVVHFNRFQFYLKIENDNQVVSSTVAFPNRNGKGLFEYVFQVNEKFRGMVDSAEIEIFGFRTDLPNEGIMCCRWKGSYLREISLQLHIVSTQKASSIKFDWLEKAVRPAMSGRVKNALTVNRNRAELENIVVGKKPDLLAPANNKLRSLFKKIHPPKSEGRFFERWGMAKGGYNL